MDGPAIEVIAQPDQPVLDYAPPPPRSARPAGAGIRWLAIVITSVLFALVHGALWMMPPIFFLSLCLGYVYERTANLWAPITVHLMFNLGPPQRILDGIGMSVFDASCVSGLLTGPLFVESGETTHLFGVRLRAEAAGALLAVPMSSLTGQLAPLPDVVGRSGTALVDRLRLARDFASRVRIVCRWIEELARRGVVSGCAQGLYCPTAPVTREQMAVFLTGTFGLTLYGP